MVKQKELSNRNDKNKENNEPKKANIENGNCNRVIVTSRLSRNSKMI